MSDNDLIRRGDALKLVEMGADWWSAHAAINALPAASATQHDFVQPTVSPDVAALVEAAEEMSAAFYSDGNVTERHLRACNAGVKLHAALARVKGVM